MKRATTEHQRNTSGERNVDNRFQLEEDGGDSTKQSWMETSGLWRMAMLHSESQGIIQVSEQYS